MNTAHKPHVCIVGAGVAGLRCADVLLEHGVRVTILEGRERIGGRLHQAPLNDGRLVDIGANWIHGTENNPILEIAKQLNCTTFSWDGRQAVFDTDGHLLSDTKAEKLGEQTWGIIAEAMAYSNENSAKIASNTSLADYFANEASRLSLDGPSRAELLRSAEMWGAFVGIPVHRQSLKFFWLEQCLDGENLFVGDSYRAILQNISKPALDKAEIQYNTVVNKIVSQQIPNTSSVHVKTSNGQSLEFDQVVMTTPLGWLKKNKPAFTPPLSPPIESAIDSLGYGNLDKVYISFKTAWWNEPLDAPITTAQGHRTPNVPSNAAPLNEPNESSISTKDHYPGYSFWMSPTYSEDTNPSHWPIECVNLATLPKGLDRPTLLFYIFGPTAHHLTKLTKEAVSPNEAEQSIINFFRPYFSRLPHYDSQNPDHQPLETLFTNWAGDELAGYGSYCNFQVGLENGDKHIEAMREGMPERGIWFAGEHTAPFVALGTTTGAYWAGEGVARRILKSYGLENGDESATEVEG